MHVQLKSGGKRSESILSVMFAKVVTKVNMM